MQKFIPLSWCLLICSCLAAQTTATFENFGLSAGEFLNGEDGGGGFRSGNLFLPNNYNPTFMAWSGWAISATTDTQTPGFTNQYSAITGGGHNGSDSYAVTFVSGGSLVYLEDAAIGGVVEGLYVTNSTYTYLSMLNGDGFAKKFGGETGDDPDFYLLTVKKYLNGELSTDSVNFYLADYRFEDNSQDYIVDDWTYLELSALGNTDSLLFTLTSTDIGQFGINTPTYFCVDNITTADMTTASNEPAELPEFTFFPNPASDFIVVDWKESRQARLIIYDINGRELVRHTIRQGQNQLNISRLSHGVYSIQVMDEIGWKPRQFIKK